jgi:hypothetical protein
MICVVTEFPLAINFMPIWVLNVQTSFQTSYRWITKKKEEEEEEEDGKMNRNEHSILV